jgi:hypothetical protein
MMHINIPEWKFKRLCGEIKKMWGKSMRGIFFFKGKKKINNGQKNDLNLALPKFKFFCHI